MSNVYYRPHEFIFKSDFNALADLSDLRDKADNYLAELKDPDDFDNSNDKAEQFNKIEEVQKYIQKLDELINFMLDN